MHRHPLRTVPSQTICKMELPSAVLPRHAGAPVEGVGEHAGLPDGDQDRRQYACHQRLPQAVLRAVPGAL